MSSDDCKSIESEPRCCEKCNPGIGKKSLSYLNNICPTTLIYTRKQCVFVQNGPEIILFWPLYQSVNLVYENLQIPVNSDGCTAGRHVSGAMVGATEVNFAIPLHLLLSDIFLT